MLLKRISAAILILVLMLLLCCCSNDGQTEKTIAEVYQETAQKFIDNGDYDSAIQALEEGISVTDSEVLKEMLAVERAKNADTEDPTEIELSQDNKEDTIDYTMYQGLWVENGTEWNYGGLIVSIEVVDNAVKFECNMVASAPANIIASFTETVDIEHISDGQTEISFDNDGYGHRGKMAISFDTDSIKCTFSNIENIDGEIWELYEKDYLLLRNDNAFNDLLNIEEIIATNAPDQTDSTGTVCTVDSKYLGSWVNADEYGDYKELVISSINGNQLVFTLMCTNQGRCDLINVPGYAYQDAVTISAEWNQSHFVDYDYIYYNDGASYNAYGSAVLNLSGDVIYVTVATIDSDSSRALYQLPCNMEKFIRLENAEASTKSAEETDALIGRTYVNSANPLETTSIRFTEIVGYGPALLVDGDTLLLDHYYWEGYLFTCHKFSTDGNSVLSFHFDTNQGTLYIRYYVYHSQYEETFHFYTP